MMKFGHDNIVVDNRPFDKDDRMLLEQLCLLCNKVKYRTKVLAEKAKIRCDPHMNFLENNETD